MRKSFIIASALIFCIGMCACSNHVNTRSAEADTAVPADAETGDAGNKADQGKPADAKPEAVKEEARTDDSKPAEGGAEKKAIPQQEQTAAEDETEEDETEQDEDDEDYSVPQDGTIEEKMASLKWEPDSNDRFDFEIEYPSFMKPMPGSENGDGMEYKWKDVTYTAWGEWADGSLKKEYDQHVKFLGHDPKYKVVKDNYYIISDFDKEGNIFYRKTVRRDDVSISIQVSYPKAYKNAMDPIVKKIAAYKPNPDGEPLRL